MRSSGIIWETNKSMSNRWRSLSTREVNLIEEGYQKCVRKIQVGKELPEKVILEPKLEVTRIANIYLSLNSKRIYS